MDYIYIYIMHPFTCSVKGFIVLLAWFHLFFFAFLSLGCVVYSCHLYADGGVCCMGEGEEERWLKLFKVLS